MSGHLAYWHALSFEDSVREFVRLAIESDWPADRLRGELAHEADNKAQEHYLRGVADAYELMREVKA